MTIYPISVQLLYFVYIELLVVTGAVLGILHLMLWDPHPTQLRR